MRQGQPLRLSLLLLLCLFCIPSSIDAFKRPHSTVVPVRGGSKADNTSKGNNRLQRYLNKVYSDADTDHNGRLNLDECYELVLRLYVQINQEAPLPPPSREKVAEFLEEADANHNHQINRQEFTALATILYGRAAVRLVTYKVVTLVVAPLMATYVAHKVGQHQPIVDFLQRTVRKLVPFAKIAEQLTSPGFGRTVLIIVFMSTLGDLVLSLVNASLDLYHLPDREPKESPQKRKRFFFF